MVEVVSTATRWDTLQGNAEDLGTKIAETGIKTALEGLYMADDEVPTNMALMAFSDSERNSNNSREFERLCNPRLERVLGKDISNVGYESSDAPLVKELVSDDKLEKKIVFPTVAKIEFVRSKQTEKSVRKPVKLQKSPSKERMTSRNLMDDMLPLGEELKEEKLLVKELLKTGHSSKETGSSQDYILMPLWKDGSLFDSSLKNASNDEPQPSSDAEKKDDEGVNKESRIDDQERPENSTQDVNTAGPSINTASTNVNTGSLNINTISPTVTTTLLEATHANFFGDETEIDMSNIITTYLVPSTPNTRIYKDHSLDHVIGDVYRNKKDERGIVVRNKARLVTQGYTQEKGIDYDEVFALVARIEAIRLVEEEVYVYQPPGFEDPEFPDRVYKVEKALYGLHQAPRAWYETLSTYLMDNGFQRGQIDKTLFIKRVKSDILLVQVYVDDIIFGSTKKEFITEYLRRLDLTEVPRYSMASTTIGDFKSFDEGMKMLKIFQVTPKVSHLHVVKRIFRYLKGQPKLGLWYPKDSPLLGSLFFEVQYASATVLDRKSITGEYVAAANCCGQVLWIQNQMLDYGYNFMNTTIFIDNESTICIVKNPVFHSKTKHIEIRHHFIRDSNEKKLIQMIKIHTYQNVADLLIKAFDVSRFQYLIASIGMLNL
ncbi:putative ribonuclease H-like domain-containing protein [Tanacetum coccineum]